MKKKLKELIEHLKMEKVRAKKAMIDAALKADVLEVAAKAEEHDVLQACIDKITSFFEKELLPSEQSVKESDTSKAT